MEVDPLTGTETWTHYDPSSETMTFETRRNVGDVTESNREEFKQYDERARWGSDVHNKVASIPDFLFWELQAKFGPMKDNQKAWMRWLDDPDNRAFRTRPGKLSR